MNEINRQINDNIINLQDIKNIMNIPVIDDSEEIKAKKRKRTWKKNQEQVN